MPRPPKEEQCTLKKCDKKRFKKIWLSGKTEIVCKDHASMDGLDFRKDPRRGVKREPRKK